jgi:hypothetical protein
MITPNKCNRRRVILQDCKSRTVIKNIQKKLGLWHYLTKTYYHADSDCWHVVGIGTHYVASSLALEATGVTVKTFDIPQST